jgi:hypothetical protein
MRLSPAIIGFTLLALSCGNSEKGFDPTHGGQSGDPGGGGSSGGSGVFGSSSSGGSTTSGNGDYVPPTVLGCSSRAQDILILDFRSGWWAGGGGGGFTNTALGAVVAACDKTSVDYHHFELSMHVKCVYTTAGPNSCAGLSPAVTVSDIESTFEHTNVGDYTQIWVLSGSDQDMSDIPAGDALFQGVVADTRGACIPMLVAAGDGFVTHANYIANDFGMGAVFTQNTNPPGFFVGSFGANVASSMKGPELTSHVLFTNVHAITDKVIGFVQQAHGDILADSVAGTLYQVIARDSDGHPTIAVGAAKLSGDGYRPFIFDAGWQRMYTLPTDPGTAQYLKNIVMYMGLVGCKAAPIGPPR